MPLQPETTTTKKIKIQTQTSTSKLALRRTDLHPFTGHVGQKANMMATHYQVKIYYTAETSSSPPTASKMDLSNNSTSPANDMQSPSACQFLLNTAFTVCLVIQNFILEL